MKEFKPKFTPTFFKETKKLKRDRRKELEKVVLKILNDPTRGKPLRYSFKGCRSEEVGKYRVIYEIVGTNVVFHYFEHRKKVYR
jgi:addiction module RelE/StbE family toxin